MTEGEMTIFSAMSPSFVEGGTTSTGTIRIVVRDLVTGLIMISEMGTAIGIGEINTTHASKNIHSTVPAITSNRWGVSQEIHLLHHLVLIQQACLARIRIPTCSLQQVHNIRCIPLQARWINHNSFHKQRVLLRPRQCMATSPVLSTSTLEVQAWEASNHSRTRNKSSNPLTGMPSPGWVCRSPCEENLQVRIRTAFQ